MLINKRIANGVLNENSKILFQIPQHRISEKVILCVWKRIISEDVIWRYPKGLPQLLVKGLEQIISSSQNSFDLFCSFFALQYLKDKQENFKEAEMVLKPGGEAIFVVASPSHRAFELNLNQLIDCAPEGLPVVSNYETGGPLGWTMVVCQKQ